MFFTFVYVNQNLSPALMDIRKMCCQLIETGFCHMKKKYAYTLQEFQDSKIKQLQEVQLYKNVSYIYVYVYVYTDIVCFIGYKVIITLLLSFLLSGIQRPEGVSWTSKGGDSLYLWPLLDGC